jgi:perosamine synthetase
MDLQLIIQKMKSMLPADTGNVSLHEPSFAGNEWDYLKDCLDSGWVSSVGKYVDRFEAMLADYTGSKYAIAVVNGTAALHTCLKLSGVQPGDEVMIPAMTFVATANAVAYCGATPHLLDVNEISLGIDMDKLAGYLQEIAEQGDDGCYNRITGARIKAIIPMHTFGHPVDMDPLQNICNDYGITVVEDAAESLGSYYKGKHTGTLGHMGALSFNGNKVITTGGGGAILTNDTELAKKAKHITTTARVNTDSTFTHDQLGYNYRMPNINAALGCAKLEQLQGMLEKKRSLAEQYRAVFRDMPGCSVFKEAEYASSNYWLNVLMLDEPSVDMVMQIIRELNSVGINARPVWRPMHKLPMYEGCPAMNLDVVEQLVDRIINLPSSPGLGGHHVSS